jgi:hypothetical protein
LAFRTTDQGDPKKLVAEGLMKRPGVTRVVCDNWWTHQPIAYFAANRRNLIVDVRALDETAENSLDRCEVFVCEAGGTVDQELIKRSVDQAPTLVDAGDLPVKSNRLADDRSRTTGSSRFGAAVPSDPKSTIMLIASAGAGSNDDSSGRTEPVSLDDRMTTKTRARKVDRAPIVPPAKFVRSALDFTRTTVEDHRHRSILAVYTRRLKGTHHQKLPPQLGESSVARHRERGGDSLESR